MASLNVPHLLGTLQQDPENEEALQALAALVDGAAEAHLDDEAVRMLDRARQGHDARAEYRASAQLLELLARLSVDDPDRAAELLTELGRLYREELLDDARAKDALQRALSLRPGDDTIQEALEQIEQAAAKWSDIAARWVEAAQASDEPSLKSSLLVSAASLIWKYKKRGRDKQVDSLFKEALAGGEGDPRAARLYERILRHRQKWSELAQMLLDAAENARGKDEKVGFYLRAARVMQGSLEEPERAAACYDRVLELVPAHAESMAYLVEHFTAREQWDRLVSLYEEALRARTRVEDEAGALLQIGMVHWRFRGSPEEAEPFFARLRKLDPAHPGMLDFYRAHLKSHDEARWVTVLTDAQRVASSEAQKLELAIELAKAAQESSTERAIDAWKVVLRLDPTHPEAPEALKALYEKTEKWNALVELLKTEVDHTPEDQPARRIALLRHLVPIYRDKLGLDVMVINTYNAMIQLDPSDREALEALAGTYESTGRWNDLIGVLSRKADASEDAQEKVALYMRVAELWIERFANYNQATDPLEKIIQIEPEHRAALAQLKEIYRKKRAFGHLFDVLSREAQLASDPGARLDYTLELAKLAGERLHRHAEAIALWKDVLEQDTEHAEALDALEKLSEREKDWATLADVLERRVAESDDAKNRVKILQKLGVIYGEHMGETIRAASAWKRILDVDPKNGRALRTLRETFLASQDWEGLEALYAEAGDWEGLVDVLGNAAERAQDSAAKVELSFRAAAIYEQKLNQPHRAFRSYERVLAADPANERAARALVPLYERDEKWNRLPALHEVLLAHAVDDAVRLEILERLRRLSVERLSDTGAAFGYAGRAFVLAPTDDGVRAALESEADRSGRHGAALELYLGRIEAVETDERSQDEVLWLRRRIASLAADRLGQTDLSIVQLREILDVHPSDEQAAEQLEGLYRSEARSRELRGLLLHRVSHALDDGQRRRHLDALARLEEEVLEDVDSAAARYRQILELDAADAGALTALDRLGVAAGRWDEVADIIRRRRALADHDGEQRELTLRLGEVLATALEDHEGALLAFGEVVEAAPDSGRAIAGLELVSAAAPGLADEAANLLEGAYEATRAWDKLGQIVAKRLAAATEPAERRIQRLRYAELSAEKIGDAGAAYQALEDAFLDEPADVEVQELLVRAAEAADRHEDLAAAFATAMEAGVLEPDDGAALAAKVAQLYDVVLARPSEAEPFHIKVLEHDPLEERSFLSLKELYTNGERWADLQKLYRDRIAQTFEAEAKLDLLMQVCFLFEELIDDPEQAIRAYRDVLELDPDHQGSRRALEGLYERTERWRDLVELLGDELARANDDEQVGLTQRLGVLHEKRLEDAAQAVDHYERVLEVEPNHKHAREALERLIANAGQRQRIASILEPIYAERGDWHELVGVLEVQLEEVAEPGAVVALLMRSAELAENRLHDPSVAFASVARAALADPSDSEVRRELARLARMRDSERERAGVLDRAVEASADAPSLQGELLLELARLWDERVGDVDQAASAYARLIEVDPDNVETVLTASRALERIHLGKGDHAALAGDLRRQVLLEDDIDEKRRLLVRLADLLEDVLEDREGAIAAHQARLELEPSDLDAMKALERLYELAGEWQKLIGILQARDGVVLEPDEQRDIARRIGAIYEESLDDRDNAIIAYNDVVARFGRDHETLDALSRLYEQAEQWQDLLDVAEMVYEMADQVGARAAIRFQMGEIMRLRTGDLERAVEAFGEVLELIPDHDGALGSLATLMGAASHGGAFEADTKEAEALPADEERADGSSDEPSDEPSEPRPFGDEAPTLEMTEADEPADHAAEDAAPLEVRIQAARVLVPRYEATALYEPLLAALLVVAESDDPIERFGALRRAAEVADMGLEDAGRAFDLQGRAVRAGLAEDDLGLMLRDLRRLADTSRRFEQYVALLQEIAPDLLDGELVVHALTQVAEVAREQLGDPELARGYYERVLEQQPDSRDALDALEELTTAAQDHPALLEVLRRKTELADAPAARVTLLLRRAALNETELADLPSAIDCFEQALVETQPREAYDGLERLYARAERYADLASHYERMLEDGVGEPVQIRYRLGITQLDRLDDAWSATEQFRTALDLDNRHAATVEALERLMENEEHRATAAEILEPVFLQQMKWPKVTACLEARIAAESDLDARKALFTRLGQIHEDYLEDLDGALEGYARLFREDVRDESTWETLSRLARVLERYDRLAAIYQGALEDVPSDDESTAKLAFMAGQIHETRTTDLEAASSLYMRALRFEPTDHGVFASLERVLQKREAWEGLLELYREQAEVAASDEDRVALLRKSARLLEEQLGQPDRAIEAYRDILGITADDRNAIAALDDLLAAQERWADMADHLRHQVELAAGQPEESDVKLRLAKVLEEKLDDLHAAIDVYEEITQADPHHLDTVKALESLVQRPEHQLRIIQLLEPIYLATDQWRKRIAIYEAQVALLEDTFDQVRLLTQIAELQETRSGDLQLAFHAWSRAMVVEPDNDEVRGQVDRSAAHLGTWDAHVRAYEDALARATEPAIRSSLLATIARVHDEKRGDPRAAIETYERLLEADPDEASPLDSLEALHTMVGDWDGLVAVLHRKVQRSYDGAERGELLRRAGSVLEELIGDRKGAVEAYKAALVEDEVDEIALESLDRLYASGEEHEPMADVLRRRIELEQDPDSRVELGLRLGEVQEQQLRRYEDAIEAYQRVLDDEAEQPQAIEALARLYERQSMWPELLDNLRLQAASAAELERKVQLLHRAGELLERELDDVPAALATHEEVLALDSHYEPGIEALLRISKLEDYRVSASDILEPLLRTQERWDELAELLVGKAQAALHPEDKRDELRRLAEVHELGRNDKSAAFEAYRRALIEDASDPRTADDLERLAVELGAWDKAANAFASRASSVLDPETGRSLYARLARIAEDHLADDTRAIEAHTRALDLVSDDADALGALDRLYLKIQAWPELGEILDRRIQVSMDPADRSELLVRLGTLKHEQFEDRRGAFRAFSEVLDRDPAEPRAIAAMESLLSDEELATEVVEVLEPVYRQTGATEKVAALFDVRIQLADTDGERMRFLQDQAQVYEDELGDPARAMAALRRAFVLDPRDEGLVDDLERLAPVANDWESLRGLVEGVLGGDDIDRMMARDLNMRAARWYRDQLGDPEAAEARLRAAVAAEPDTREAHEQLVELLRAPGREVDLVAALVTWADVDFDEDAKKTRLREAAALAESAGGDSALAASCYGKILDSDPSDADALDQLVRLESDAGRHAKVAELLVRRIDVESLPEARITLRKRLARVQSGPLDDAQAAIEAWRGALDEEPSDLETIGALEGLYEKLERYEDLEELIQRRLDVAETPSERIAARVRLARLADQRLGRRDEAIEQLREILEEDPGNAEALDELERLFTADARWEELVELLEGRAGDAVAAGDAAAELDALVRLGSVQVEHLRAADKAITIYRRVLEREPQHLAALRALADLHRERQDWPAVADALEQLGAVQEGAEAIETAFAVAELAAGTLSDPPRAERALRAAYELDPSSAKARDALKAHYEKHGQSDRLAEMLVVDEQETAEPKQKVVLLKRIAALYAGALEDPGSAATYLERASQLDPDDREVLLPLCDLYIAAGRQGDAVPVLEQIIASYGTRRNKEVAVYHHRLGKARQSMGDLDGALESYDAAFKVDLTNIQVLSDLGRLCLTRGDFDRAQKTFRALLLQKLAPNEGISKADVYFYLGDIAAKQGDPKKAISMLERAVAEDSSHTQASELIAKLKG